MSTYTKMVMLPIDVYHNVIGSSQQQPVHETRQPAPIKNDIIKSKPRKCSRKKKNYKREAVRQLLSSM